MKHQAQKTAADLLSEKLCFIELVQTYVVTFLFRRTLFIFSSMKITKLYCTYIQMLDKREEKDAIDAQRSFFKEDMDNSILKLDIAKEIHLILKAILNDRLLVIIRSFLGKS